MRTLALVVVVVALGSVAAAEPPKATEVWLRGKAGKLQSWLWRPAGAGPFPAVVYNHGSEKDPIVGTDSAIGSFFVAHGYAVLFPYRRGAGKSAGRYWNDGIDALPEAQQEKVTIDRLVQENDDVVTAIEWLRGQPWIARDDITVGGCSFGGIETLLTAERSVPGLRAALDFAGASMAWDDSPLLRERLLGAVEHARVPVCAPRSCRSACAFSAAPATRRWPAMRAFACSAGTCGATTSSISCASATETSLTRTRAKIR
ncbi:MAG TPA: CocE/NonD family hydrolase [Polyangia bacterium]